MTARKHACQFLNAADMDELSHFYMQICEGDGYTAGKETMQRLAELGVVQHVGFGRYQITSFGEYCFNLHFEQATTLPLKTCVEYNEDSRKTMLAKAVAK